VTIDWWTLALQAINAIVLLWLLAHFFFRPVAAMVERRKEEAERILGDAEAQRSAAAKEHETAEAERKSVADARAAELDQVSKEAAKLKDELLQAAHKEADEVREAGQADLDRMHKTAEQETEHRAAELALAMAQRLLGRLPTDALIAPFLPGFADALAGLSDEAKAELAEQKGRIVAPRALTNAEREDLNERVTNALGKKVSFAVKTDPAVIAGLEWRGGHVQVRNSFRADLERIAADVTEND
jgi:F-type H+-transporting ATPase subunit b